MDSREHAKKLFDKSIYNAENLDTDTQKQIYRSIYKMLRESLSTLPKKERFTFKETWLVILKTAEDGKLVPEKAAEAFQNLKTYFILLFRAPWKKEFRRLKTYGGHFQSKIKAYIEDPESIICLVGFQPEGSGTFSLKGEADSNLLLSVAFECVVASVECEIIAEFHRKMKEGGALVTDVVRWRDTGVMPEIKQLSTSTKDPVKSIAHDSAYGSSSHAQRSSSNGHGSSSNGQRPMVLGAEGGYGKNLPFIDEDDNILPNDTGYVEGTIDEHYMASLQRLSQNSSERPAPQHQSASNEWSYVTNTLKSKYGQEYYEGPRGDVIRNTHPNVRMRNDDLSDEGIDIEEEPPRVNFQHPPVSIQQTTQRSIGSRDRTRDSGYRTASSSQVHYPPMDSTSSKPYHLHTPTGVDPFLSHSSGRSQPLMARGLPERQETGYPNIDRLGRKSNIYDSYNRSAQAPGRTADLMSRNMQSLGLDAEWSCGFCTYRNDRSVVVCEGCHKSRDQRPEMDGPQCGDSIRVCKQCTLENEPGQMICSVCGNALDNVHTYV